MFQDKLKKLSEMTEKLFGGRRREPVERFCKMIARLPTFGREEALRTTGSAIGWEADPETALNSTNPAQEIFRPPTIEELEKRMHFLVSQVRIQPMLLIPGLLQHLLWQFRSAATKESTSLAIDRDLGWLQRLEAMKQMPVEERPVGFSDEAIEKIIPRIKEVMQQHSAKRERAQEAAEILEEEWGKTFPHEYWVEWLQWMAENA